MCRVTGGVPGSRLPRVERRSPGVILGTVILGTVILGCPQPRLGVRPSQGRHGYCDACCVLSHCHNRLRRRGTATVVEADRKTVAREFFRGT